MGIDPWTPAIYLNTQNYHIRPWYLDMGGFAPVQQAARSL